MACYTGLLLASAEGFGLWLRAFFALWARKYLIMLFWQILCDFCCPVVTMVAFSSNLSNFKKNTKNPKKSKEKKRETIKKIQKYI